MEKSTIDIEFKGKIDIIYSKSIPIYIKCADKEDHKRFLRVVVEHKSGISPVCQQELTVHISDDEDPYLIFGMTLAEDDFKVLKQQQGLLVDFENFFEHLIRLFDQCIQSTSSKFLLVLTKEQNRSPALTSQTYLQVIEMTNFKNLCHLSLSINEGSDTEVKRNMTMRIKKLQDDVRALEAKLTTTENDLIEKTNKLEIKSETCDKIYGKCVEEKNELQLKMTEELVREKEKFAMAQVEWQKTSDLEKRCIEDKYEDIVKHLENQVSSLKVQLQSSIENNSKVEFSNRELKNQLDALDKEFNNFEKEVASLRKQNSQLDSDYHDKERAVQNLRTRFAVLEQELKDKSEMLSKQLEGTKILAEQKSKLEAALIEKEGILLRQETSLQTISEDFIKANDILTLHQNELVSARTKLQLSNNIVFEQEKVLELKSKKIEDMTKLLDQSNLRIKELEDEGKKVKEQLQKLEKTLEEKEKRLQLNEDVIDRLNRRLNESYSQQTAAHTNPFAFKSRAPHQFLGPRTTSTPLNTINVTSQFIHSSLGAPPLAASGNRSNIQTYVPLRMAGLPQRGFGRAAGAAFSSSRAFRGGDAHLHGDGPNVHRDGPSVHGENLRKENDTEPSACDEEAKTSQLSKQRVNKDDTTRKDVMRRPTNVEKRQGPSAGGILKVDPPPISAYFSTSEKS